MQEQINYYSDKLKYEIDSWDLSQSLNDNKKVIVIDARSKEAFDLENIPTSINIPHRTMNKETTKDLDKTYLYVTYCDGIGCNASTKGALKMAELGFEVKELLGGLDWWKRDGHNIACGC
jgi:rhodanese-related sulfurtransferase